MTHSKGKDAPHHLAKNSGTRDDENEIIYLGAPRYFCDTIHYAFFSLKMQMVWKSGNKSFSKGFYACIIVRIIYKVLEGTGNTFPLGAQNS